MAIAAVPKYLGEKFDSASPGDRFTMFLSLWGQNRRSGDLLWTTSDIAYEVRGQARQEREVKYENKTSAITAALKLNTDDQQRNKALVSRLNDVAKITNNILTLKATSTAPFATGLGLEHPLETGFAFLNPYGLPYLAGSSVKGVLRKAAEELKEGLFGDKKGWTPAAIDALFGLESEDGGKDHQRGALIFWDVIPQINGNRLVVEIMTPHQSHYLQGNESPHESGSPNPISFLAVPAGSEFTFYVQCNKSLLEKTGAMYLENWQALLNAAFEHAFNWLGFGAKTAVGYGAMQSEAQHQTQQTAQQQQAITQAHAEGKPVPVDTSVKTIEWQGVELVLNPGSGALTASYQGKTATGHRDKTMMDEAFKAKLKDKKKLKAILMIEQEGNSFIIKKADPLA